MSKLREKITPFTTTCIYSLTEQCPFKDNMVCKGCIENLNQILTAFKAYIEECERPENPYNKTDTLSYGQFLHKGFLKGVEAYRKALMESLE